MIRNNAVVVHNCNLKNIQLYKKPIFKLTIILKNNCRLIKFICPLQRYVKNKNYIILGRHSQKTFFTFQNTIKM